MYYYNIIISVNFAMSAKWYGKDVLDIPSELYFSLFMRIVGGFFSDVFLYIAFNQTKYSKAVCLCFTNTLLIPFFGRCIIKEKILKYDVLAIIIGFAGMLMII
jgi:drug/metabolite transporter (DMT)-like permease